MAYGKFTVIGKLPGVKKEKRYSVNAESVAAIPPSLPRRLEITDIQNAAGRSVTNWKQALAKDTDTRKANAREVAEAAKALDELEAQEERESTTGETVEKPAQ